MRVATRWLPWILCASLLGPMGPAASETLETAALAGEWVRTDLASDDAARDAAIEQVTGEMSFLVRGIARAVMSRAMAPAERILIEDIPGGLRLRLGVDAPLERPLSSPPSAAEDGVTSTRTSAGFEESWRHDESTHGTTRWALSPDGSKLAVTALVVDGRFSGPLEYTTHYRRVYSGPPLGTPPAGSEDPP